MQNLLETNPQLIIALSFTTLTGMIIIIAMLKGKTMDEIGKLWTMLGPLLGVVAGFYFTREQAREQLQQLRQDNTKLAAALSQTRNYAEMLAYLPGANHRYSSEYTSGGPDNNVSPADTPTWDYQISPRKNERPATKVSPIVPAAPPVKAK